MAMVDPKPGKPYVKKDNQARGDVSGIIGMTGSARGSLALSFSTKCILKIVSNMLGENHTEINGDVRDAVGEITNMISGVARKNRHLAGCPARLAQADEPDQSRLLPCRGGLYGGAYETL